MEKIFSQNERKYALLFFLQWYSLKIFDSTLTLDLMPWTGLTYNHWKKLVCPLKIAFSPKFSKKTSRQNFWHRWKAFRLVDGEPVREFFWTCLLDIICAAGLKVIHSKNNCFLVVILRLNIIRWFENLQKLFSRVYKSVMFQQISEDNILKFIVTRRMGEKVEFSPEN